jgi:hypothetical protein
MCVDGGRMIYKFRWRFLPCLWLVVFFPFSIFFGVAWMHRDGVLGGVIFLAVAMIFVLLVGLLLLMALSDIEVDEVGIARRVLAFRWQSLRWVDLSKIHVSMSKNPQNGQDVRAFVFVARPGVGAFFSRRITFQERQPEMLPLLQEIHRYISLYKVVIEDQTAK